MLGNIGNIKVLTSSCNIETVVDGRGGIFTWLPELNIVEFNMVYFLPNKIRGNHFHPEFFEYFLVVDGTILMVTKDDNGNEISMQASRGVCFCTPPNTPHAVHAITQSICVSLLTKKWDDCKNPIIYTDIIPFDDNYIKHMNSIIKDYNPSDNNGKNIYEK